MSRRFRRRAWVDLCRERCGSDWAQFVRENPCPDEGEDDVFDAYVEEYADAYPEAST